MSDGTTAVEPGNTAWRWRLLALLLIAGTACLRLVYLSRWCGLELAPDEAHYWDWSRHLDWSYYSKGPLVAVLIRLSCWLAGDWSRQLVGSEMVAVRLPAVLCGSLLLGALYLLAARICQRESRALLMLAVVLTMPVVSVGATLMTIDAPYTCCWAWALVLAHQAIFRRSAWAWPVLGLVIGLGILAKYTMLLWFPSLGLFLLFSRSYRPLLWHWGLWCSVLIAALCCLPILIWNLQHDWVGLLHVEHQAGMRDTLRQFAWLGPLLFLGSQFGLLLGFWFVAWLRAVWAYAPWRAPTEPQQFLWWMSVTTFLVFLGFSIITRGGQGNWAVAAYLSGSVLVLLWLVREVESYSLWPRRLLLTSILGFGLLGLLLIVLVHAPDLSRPLLAALAGQPTERRPLPLTRLDPTVRLHGWRTLAAAVDEQVRRLRSEGQEPIVACGSWSDAGELAFYCQETNAIYSIGVALGCRRSQYDLWHPSPVHDPEQFLGRTFICVGETLPVLLQAFDSTEASQTICHREQGIPLAIRKITIGRGYRGFTQDYNWNPFY